MALSRKQGPLQVATTVPRSVQPHTAAPAVLPIGHSTEEPSWVTNLVGHAPSPQPAIARSADGLTWQDRDAMLRKQYAQIADMPQRWDMATPPPLGYLQQQQQMLNPPPFAAMSKPSFMPSPLAQVQAHNRGPFTQHDAGVIELARSKGLNPAFYDCRPPIVRVLFELVLKLRLDFS